LHFYFILFYITKINFFFSIFYALAESVGSLFHRFVRPFLFSFAVGLFSGFSWRYNVKAGAAHDSIFYHQLLLFLFLKLLLLLTVDDFPYAGLYTYLFYIIVFS